MSAALLRRAAETMRREEEPVFDELAELLEEQADGLAECGRLDSPRRLAERCVRGGAYYRVIAIARAYLHDPGDVPAGGEG